MSQVKKIIFIALLILFTPTAIYLLVTGNFIPFLVVALFVYIAIKVVNRYLE